MEFKYRAVDKKPQPPPSPPHSKYPSSATTNFYSEQPFGGESGFARMVPPAMSAREAFQRELEKERIRREIIAEEMARARRRELEEEVRREMALERELGFPMQRSLGQQQRFLFQERVNMLNSVSVVEIDDMPPKPRSLDFAEMEPAVNQDPLLEQANLRLNSKSNLFAIEDMPQPHIELNQVAIEDMSQSRIMHSKLNQVAIENMSQLRIMDPKSNQVAIENMPQSCIIDIAEIIPTNNQDEVITLAKPDPDVYEAKRKAAELGVNDSQFRLMKKPKNEWRCSLCGVSATDERNLNEHRRSKKHKAKETAHEAEKIGKSTNTSLSSKKSNMNIVKSTETIIITTSGFDVKPDIKTHKALGEGSMTQNKVDAVKGEKEEQIVQKSQDISVSEINEVTNEEVGKTNALVGRRMKFWCEICGISTTSQSLLEGHKRGKKHRRQTETKTMSQNNGNALHASSADNFSCSEEVHPIAGSREDRVGKTNTLVGRQMKFWCEICGISTTSQSLMEGHKRGKKHRRQTETKT